MNGDEILATALGGLVFFFTGDADDGRRHQHPGQHPFHLHGGGCGRQKSRYTGMAGGSGYLPAHALKVRKDD